MSNIITLPQLPWHGPKKLELPLPDGWQVEVCNLHGYNRPALTDEQIKHSIENPIGTVPIRELARGKKNVVILFDDMTRPTRVSKIVPFILEELAKAGISDNKIRFMAAVGNHGAMNRQDFVKKLGEKVLTRFPVYNHNPFSNCTYIGTTSRGNKVSVNTEVMLCDLKISIDSVTPHGLAAFSAGGKMILPGVASIETTLANHTIECSEEIRDNYELNPLRLDMEEAARMAQLDIVIECVVNLWGETVAIFVGAEIPAHEASVKEARTHYLTPMAKNKDIAIANSYAKASESMAGLKAAASVREGGDLVLVCNAPEGQVVHYLFGTWGKMIGGGKISLPFKIPQHINRLILFSEYPDLAGLGQFENSPKLVYINDSNELLKALIDIHGASASVAVYPNADIMYFG